MTTYENELMDIEKLEMDEFEINEDDIYSQLEDIENLMLDDDKGTCVDCGDKNGTLCLDPYSYEIYGEPTTVFLCRDCSGGNSLY